MDNLKDMKDEVLVVTNASDGNKPHVVERIGQDGSLNTRAAIIETLLKREYMVRCGNPDAALPSDMICEPSEDSSCGRFSASARTSLWKPKSSSVRSCFTLSV